MILTSLVKVLRAAGISQGDTICVSSDIAKLGIPREIKPDIRQYGMDALTNLYIDTLLFVLGKSGTLVMPTFTYSACEGEVFDVALSPSKVGMLTEAFRQYPNTVRSEHPIFSFAFNGRMAKQLAEVQSFDCFGKNSLFDRLHKLNAKYLLLGVNMWQGSTYVYYSEQKYGVSYRFMKNFLAEICHGCDFKLVLTPYFVRNNDIGYEDDWQQLQADSIKEEISTEIPFMAGKIIAHNAVTIDAFIQQKLTVKPEYLIRYL
jgi:aminoglycoside 3-N-acetyltransferase